MLILEPGEPGARIPRSDRRYGHIRKVLRKKVGDRLVAGIATGDPFGPAPGMVGEAIIRTLDDSGIVLDYEAYEGERGSPPELAPLCLVLGFPRPIQANRIFRNLASLGVAEIRLAGTELGEKSYLESGFFRSGEFHLPLLEGAEQAANPRLPRVFTHWSLRACLDALKAAHLPLAGSGSLYVLHPGEGAAGLGSIDRPNAPVTLAIGSERGWTEGELGLLVKRGFRLLGLGARILRTETAAEAAIAIILGKLGLM